MPKEMLEIPLLTIYESRLANMSENESAWSYHIWSAKIPSVKSLEHSFMLLGEQGWELVTSVSTIKTWSNLTGNDLIFVFKKPGKGHVFNTAFEELENDGTW